MAEAPYMLAVALTLLLLDRSRTERGFFVAGVVAAAAFLIRGYAVIFLPVGVLFILLRLNGTFAERMKYALFFAIPLLVAVLAWMGYTHIAIASGQIDGFTARYGNGANILDGLMRSPLEHLQRFYWHDGRHPLFLMIPLVDAATVRGSFPLFLGSIGLLAFVGIGWAGSLKRPLSSVTIWFPVKIAILWAVTPAFRYWLPLLPYLFFFAILGAYYLSRQTRRLRYAYSVFVSILLAANMTGFISHLANPDRLRYYDQYGLEARDIAIWARDHLPPKAIIITEAPGDIFSAARRRAFSLGAAAANWIPAEFAHEEDIYLLCPANPKANTHYPSSYENCERLKRKNQFVTVRELPLIGIYRFIATESALTRPSA